MVGRARALGRVESVLLKNANGRILSEPVFATRTQPSFDASAMDGYAVRAADLADLSVPLKRIGESAAGRAFSGTMGPGQCVRIFTGAPVPNGADAILIQEDADVREDGVIRATETVAVGQHVRPAGVDFKEGETLLEAGIRLTPGAVALAASGGHPKLAVLSRPKVAIVATGDELVLPGEAVGPSQIVASNSFGVAAMMEAAGGVAMDCGIAGDSLAAIAERLDEARAAGADIFVTIGGASVGDHDLVGAVFASRGVALDFWKVAMRPGKPLMAGKLDAMHIVGLPGNPASSMVAATLFLAPLVRRLAGITDRPLYKVGFLGADMPQNGMRTDFARARIERRNDGIAVITPWHRQDSSLLSIYAKADALLVRDPHAPAARQGDPCRFVALD